MEVDKLMKYTTIDIELALAQLGGSDQLYKRVIMGFYERYREVDLTIGNYINNGEPEEARRIAHSIKGLSGNLGAVILAEKALNLEKAIKLNDPKQESYLEVFSQELGEVVKDLTLLIQHRYKPTESASNEGVKGPDEFLAACRNLKAALGTYRYSEVKVAKDQLINNEMPVQHKEEMVHLMALIDSYDYDAAIGVLGKVCG